MVNGQWSMVNGEWSIEIRRTSAAVVGVLHQQPNYKRLLWLSSKFKSG
jgi:hypothetical protein